MDCLTFTVEISKALAWPATVLLIALLFQKEVRQLLNRIKKGKFGPAEVEFEFEEAIKGIVEEIALPQAAPSVGISAKQDARSIVLSTWAEVDSVIQNLARIKNNVDPKFPKSSYKSMLALYEAGVVSEEYAQLYYQLRNLKNRVVHEPHFNPTQESLFAFVQISKNLIKYLSELVNT